jgi:ankyrin repeat protein
MNNNLQLLKACKDNASIDVIRHLLMDGANPNIEDIRGDTPIFYASDNLLGILLEAGADINHIGSRGRGLIHDSTGTPDRLAFLINQGADINLVSRDIDHATPLIIAVKQGHLKAVKILLESGADTEIQDADGKTAVYYTYTEPREADERLEFLKLLVEAGADVNIDPDSSLLHIGILTSNVEWVRTLLEAGADPYQVDFQGRIPLDLVRIGDKEILVYLLTYMPSLPQRFEAKYGDLYGLIRETQKEAIEELALPYEDMYDPNLGNSILRYLR